MECQPSDSKKLFKVFDASKRKRARKKREGDDSNSIATDDSAGVSISDQHNKLVISFNLSKSSNFDIIILTTV